MRLAYRAESISHPDVRRTARVEHSSLVGRIGFGAFPDEGARSALVHKRALAAGRNWVGSPLDGRHSRPSVQNVPEGRHTRTEGIHFDESFNCEDESRQDKKFYYLIECKHVIYMVCLRKRLKIIPNFSLSLETCYLLKRRARPDRSSGDFCRERLDTIIDLCDAPCACRRRFDCRMGESEDCQRGSGTRLGQSFTSKYCQKTRSGAYHIVFCPFPNYSMHWRKLCGDCRSETISINGTKHALRSDRL